MSTTRKAKRAMKKTPLSSVDKAIYITIIIAAFLLTLGMIWFAVHTIPVSVAYADETVVASETYAMLLSVPFIMLITMTPMILANMGLTKKQPIFGNKRHKPSILKPEIKMVPLMSKDFPSSLSYSTKRKIKRTAIVLVVISVIFALLIPFGVHPRTVLDTNNNIITYNSFNKVTDKCNIKDAEKLIIDISDTGGKGRNLTVYLTFAFADKLYDFNVGSFERMNTEETLNYMLYLKSMFEDNRYEITDVHLMDELLFDRNYNAKETELVYELFDYTE